MTRVRTRAVLSLGLLALSTAAARPATAGSARPSAVAASAAAGSAAPDRAAAAPDRAAAAPGRLLVRLRPEAAAAGGFTESSGADPAARLGLGAAAATERLGPDLLAVTVAAADVAAAADVLARDPAVLHVQPDYVYEATRVPNDPRLGQQSYLGAVNAPQAWDETIGSAQVLVAVLDTQVTPHPDLVGKVVDGGDFVIPSVCSGGTSAADHGTAVAGIAGAATNDGAGIAGMGWNTRVLAVRVLCDDGAGVTSAIAPAIRAAADQGAGVINMSFATRSCGPYEDDELADAVRYARNKGAVLVAAAGNTSCRTPSAPADLDGVIAVGATDGTGALASFSNRGLWVDIAAPGVGIYAPVRGGGYGQLSGTSFAAPLVSATAALIVAAHPGITADGVASRLRRGAATITGVGTDVAWGALDAGAALAVPAAGYWTASAGGGVKAIGDNVSYGSLAGTNFSARIVAMVATRRSDGYWLAGADGAVYAFGGAAFVGSIAGTPLSAPIVGMAATPTGAGYWLVASDGGVFAFGDARFLGSMGGKRLNKPIVGLAATSTGAGYWLVASDGGIFSFGDARFLGSMGGTRLFRPVVGMAATTSGDGYWLVASDGGIFAFGDAAFRGSTGGTVLNDPIVGMVPTATGLGYWLVASDGGVFAFGDAPFLGSAVGVFVTPVVGLAG